MSTPLKALGVYRETEFSPGKVGDDAAILDLVLNELSGQGLSTSALTAARFCSLEQAGETALVLAMCQSERALKRLAEFERAGAIAVNSALAIRNCYRDLLGAGLIRAGVPTPGGALVRTARPFDYRGLAGLNLDGALFVKRGDLHALAPEDVTRASGRAELEAALDAMGARGVRAAFVQQLAPGRGVKFYGVSGGEYFAALGEDGELPSRFERELSQAAANAAGALGLEAWGGDAVIGEDSFRIIDFNDWPSYSRVRETAARAIARRCMRLLRRAAAT